MRFLKKLGIFFFFLYILICIGLYVAQEQLLFYPDTLPADYVYRKGVEQRIDVAGGKTISTYFNKVDNSKGVILYFHGNKGSIRRCIRQSQMMENLEYDILMPDYRSYGKSDGPMESQAQFYDDAQKVYDFLKTKYDESQIVIVGYSMGSSAATYLAAENSPKELFLISPFKSIVDLKNKYVGVVPNFIIKYQFPNWKYLPLVKCPVSVFYTKNDRVVLPESTLELMEYCDHETLYELGNTSHRGAIFHDEVRRVLRERL